MLLLSGKNLPDWSWYYPAWIAWEKGAYPDTSGTRDISREPVSSPCPCPCPSSCDCDCFGAWACCQPCDNIRGVPCSWSGDKEQILRDLPFGEATSRLTLQPVQQLHRPLWSPWAFFVSFWRKSWSIYCSFFFSSSSSFAKDCPWVGNCVGRRNHRYFVLFTSLCTLLLLFIFSFSLAHLVILCVASDKPSGFEKLLAALSETPISLVLMIYTLMFSFNLCGLTIFHLVLLCQNQTTNEQMKPYLKNAYTDGCPTNTARFCCGPIPSSFINFNAILDDEDLTSKPLIHTSPVASNATTDFF